MRGIGKLRDIRNIRSFKKRVSFQNVPVGFYNTLNGFRKEIGKLTREEGCKLKFHQTKEGVQMDVSRRHSSMRDFDTLTYSSRWGVDGTVEMPNKISPESIMNVIKNGIAGIKKQHFHMYS